MRKVSVIGHFGFGINAADGQTVKTKILTEELIRQYGEEEVGRIDTHGGIKTLLKAPFQVFAALKKAKNVIMLPAHNGVRIFGRLLPLCRRLFKGRRIHYAVIGGWLPTFLEQHRRLAVPLKKFDGIYVETRTMKAALEAQGFRNVYVMPNCKELMVLHPDELVYSTEEPYRLCTFSRVTKEKGIETAIEAVKTVNEELGHVAFSLDIFGQVDKDKIEWFGKLQKSFPEYIRYGGVVPFDKSVEVLKEYYALLFPTYYEGEGFAGTLIDSFAAGVPVIASDWRYNSEIVENEKNGFVYPLADKKGLEKVLYHVISNVEELNEMKVDCLIKAAAYSPQVAIRTLLDRL